jgi:GLPGLI family protein
MKKSLFLFLFILFPVTFWGQRQLLKVQYDQTNQGFDHQNFNLFLYEKFSHYILDFDNELFFKESENRKNARASNAKRFKYYLVKDYKNKFLIKPSTVGTVRDSLGIIKWKIEKGNKEILAYACKKATCEFRGRKYTAYYTPKISIPDGPYKFYGLPGLILEISSEDHFIHLEAKSITKGDNSIFELPKTMYDKHMDFREYTKKKTEQLEEYVKKGEARLPLEKQGLKFSAKEEELEKF